MDNALLMSVLHIKARWHRELVTVVGTLPEVCAGKWLEAQGRWIVKAYKERTSEIMDARRRVTVLKQRLQESQYRRSQSHGRLPGGSCTLRP